jgi:RNA polymerase sigma factor (sigma-70 family)
MNPLTTEQQELAADGFKPATDIAKRYAKLFPEHADDIESSAAWGSIRAAATWDYDKGAMFGRWLDMCVNSEIQNFIDRSKIRRHKPLPDRYDDAETNEAEADLEKEEVEANRRLNMLLAYLPESQRRICELVYRHGVTPSEAGPLVGVTASTGIKQHRASLAILRERMSA